MLGFGPGPRRGCRRVLWALVVALLLVLLFVASALRVFPVMTIGLLGLIAMWLLFFCGEEPLIQLVTSKASDGGRCSRKLLVLAGALRTVQGLRSSHEKEHWIKAVLISFGLIFVLFNPEVGLSAALFERFQPLMALSIITSVFSFSVCAAHCTVKLMHERARRRGRLPIMGTPRGSQAVQELTREIARCLQERGWQKQRESERRIHDILSQSDKDTLNELLERLAQSAECSLDRIISFCRDTAERAARKELIELLCMHRVNFLSVRAKSAILHSLMVARLSSCSVAEAGVEQLLLSEQGDNLSDLKSMQDGLGDIHSMHKLIFQDMTDETLRNRVLNHFLVEGMNQVAHRALMSSGHLKELLKKGHQKGCIPLHLNFAWDALFADSRGGSENEPAYDGKRGHSWLKIITDMDDTLQCSGARWPAGIDGRYPRHKPYPGVTAFYRELQGGEGLGSQLVALSARPHIVGELVEQGIFKRFSHLMEEHGLHAMPALLTGSVDSGGKFLLSGGDEAGMRALAKKKFENFREYLALYPEFRIVFIGDNGQADYAVGQMMARFHEHNVEQVWIHEVQPREKTFRYQMEQDPRVCFFEDYVMAAVSAVTRQPPLISPEGLKRIVLAVRDDFKKITGWPSEGHREAELERLNQSILRALPVLSTYGIHLEEEAALIEGGRSKTSPRLAAGESPDMRLSPSAKEAPKEATMSSLLNIAQRFAMSATSSTKGGPSQAPRHASEPGAPAAETLEQAMAGVPQVEAAPGVALEPSALPEVQRSDRSVSLFGFGLGRGLVKSNNAAGGGSQPLGSPPPVAHKPDAVVAEVPATALPLTLPPAHPGSDAEKPDASPRDLVPAPADGLPIDAVASSTSGCAGAAAGGGAAAAGTAGRSLFGFPLDFRKSKPAAASAKAASAASAESSTPSEPVAVPAATIDVNAVVEVEAAQCAAAMATPTTPTVTAVVEQQLPLTPQPATPSQPPASTSRSIFNLGRAFTLGTGTTSTSPPRQTSTSSEKNDAQGLDGPDTLVYSSMTVTCAADSKDVDFHTLQDRAEGQQTDAWESERANFTKELAARDSELQELRDRLTMLESMAQAQPQGVTPQVASGSMSNELGHQEAEAEPKADDQAPALIQTQTGQPSSADGQKAESLEVGGAAAAQESLESSIDPTQDQEADNVDMADAQERKPNPQRAALEEASKEDAAAE